MKTNKKISIKELKALSSQELGCSDWIELPQEKVTQFAEITGDFQFIHVDPEAAAKAGFGGTIVHGYYLLSLVSKFIIELLPEIDGAKMVFNYGLNKVRFIAPVPVGSQVRGRVSLIEVTDRDNGQIMTTTAITMEIQGQDKPAFVAEQLNLFIF